MEIIGYQELKERLLAIPVAEHRALLCSIYATMAREGEVVRGRYKKTLGLLGENITSFSDKMEINLISEKTGRPRLIILFRNREAWLIGLIESWKGQQPGPLFPFSTRKAEYVFKKYFPELSASKFNSTQKSKHTIHWLRGWRYSHYRHGDVTGRRVEAKVACFFGGWLNSAIPDKFYDFTTVKDFESELKNEPAKEAGQ
jgi:hypothetical protein